MKKTLFASFLAASLITTAAQGYELTVTNLDGDTVASFTGDDLKAMGGVKLVTETPWTDGVVTFEGVSWEAIEDAIGEDVDLVTAIALDNYIIEIPTQVLNQDDAIIAYSLDGAPMPPSEQGPYWIMFNFDEAPVDRGTELRNYSVWQLVELQLN